MANKKTSKGTGVGAGVAVAGAAAALAAAAAAGYYFYASDDAKKHRAKAAKWAAGFKKEVMAQAKKSGKLDQKSLAAAIDSAASMYASAKKISGTEVSAAAKELKKHWKDLAVEMSRPRGKKMGRAVRAAFVSKPAKKASKSAKKRS